MPSAFSSYFNVELDADYRNRLYTLRIEYKFLPEDRKRVATLRCLPGNFEYRDRLPFAYKIVDAVPGDRYEMGVSIGAAKSYGFTTHPVLRLVAGPGVEIKLEGFKADAPPNARTPGLEIFRLQSPASIPIQGTGINPAYYQGLAYLPEDFWSVLTRARKISAEGSSRVDLDLDSPINISPQPVRVGDALKTVLQNAGNSFFLDVPRQPPLVAALYDGLRIVDVTTDTHLHVSVPVHGPKSARARFAYSIDYDGRNPTVVHLVRTPEVAVEYFTLYRQDLADGDYFPPDHFPLAPQPRPVDLIREVLADKFEVRESIVRSLDFVPEQGEDRYLDQRATIQPEVPISEDDIRVMKERSLEIGRTVVDVGVGFIPIVGDVVDLGEAIIGYDKWGRKLSTTDRILTGVAVVIPFVGGKGLRLLRMGKKAP